MSACTATLSPDSVTAILAHAPAKFVLAGTSYGGMVAIAVALAAPERITALWLVGCDPSPPQPGGAERAPNLEAAPETVLNMLAGLVVHKVAVGAAVTFRDMARSVGAGAGAARVRALSGRADITAPLGELEDACSGAVG